MKNPDKFNKEFRPSISGQVWGHGEYGYVLTIFASHEKEECEKALAYFKANLGPYMNDK